MTDSGLDIPCFALSRMRY